jgi:putative oxidoreductase
MPLYPQPHHILLLGRIFFVALFVVSSQGHIVNRQRYVTLAKGKLPVPYVAGWPLGAWVIVAILSVVLGIWPDVGMLMIAAFLIPTTLLFHPYWTFSDRGQRQTNRGGFYRNISLLGATLALFALFTVAGPGLPFFNLR